MADDANPQDSRPPTGGNSSAKQPPSGSGAATQTSGTQASGKRTIPAHIKEKYPQLEELIMNTESMTEEERAYWFQIMPIMTDEQVEKLLTILIREKEQLAKLDAEYEAELKTLNEKHLLEWKDSQAREAREKREAAESVSQAEDEEEAESLLAQLDDLEQ